MFGSRNARRTHAGGRGCGQRPGRATRCDARQTQSAARSAERRDAVEFGQRHHGRLAESIPRRARRPGPYQRGAARRPASGCAQVCALRVAMAEIPTLPPGLQRPPPANRSNKWSLFSSSLVILAFSLRLLGDKWEHQARRSCAWLRMALRCCSALLTRPGGAGGAGGAAGGAGGVARRGGEPEGRAGRRLRRQEAPSRCRAESCAGAGPGRAAAVQEDAVLSDARARAAGLRCTSPWCL